MIIKLKSCVAATFFLLLNLPNAWANSAVLTANVTACPSTKNLVAVNATGLPPSNGHLSASENRASLVRHYHCTVLKKGETLTIVSQDPYYITVARKSAAGQAAILYVRHQDLAQ